MNQRLNFSPRPFRIRSKFLTGLWALNLVALLGLLLIAQYGMNLHKDNKEVHQELDQLKVQEAEIADAHRAALEKFENLEVHDYRKKIERFAAIQRAFDTHWGPLLDDIAAILPEDVRLLKLKPVASEHGSKRREAEIRLSAESRIKQAQLDFIQALQKQAGFSNVRLENEAYQKTNEIVHFDLLFIYQPKGE